MKKQIFPFILLIFAMYSCSNTSDHSKENLALIDNYIQAVQNLDYDAMNTILDDNYVGFGPSYGDSIGKGLAIQNWQDNVENLYDKIVYDRSRSAALVVSSGANEGDWISNWAELHITYKDGRGEVTIWANSIYLIVNKKIVKSYTFYNEADVLEQLGYVFINPENL